MSGLAFAPVGRTLITILSGTQGAVADVPTPAPVIEGGGKPYIHTQASAATVWTVNHNLGFYPVIQPKTTGGAVIRGVVQHVSLNQATITFNTPVAGQAIAR